MRKGISAAACLLLIAGGARADLLVNGDFEAGLSGWTVFTTANGTLGDGMPVVELFDTNNDGTATNSAKFRVAKVADLVGRAGGGIYQDVYVPALGTYQLRAYTAMLDDVVPSNADGGLFELLFDGVVVDSHDYGAAITNVPEYELLAADLMDVSPGTHEIRVKMSRRYLSGDSDPWQYIDDVSFVPVPGALLLGLAGFGTVGLVGKVRKSRAQAVRALSGSGNTLV